MDVETTIFQKGDPHSSRNRLCYVGVRINDTSYIFDIEYSGKPYGPSLNEINRLLSSCKLVVGFNLKFDLAWLYRYGIRFDHCNVWDCQLAEFLESHQQIRFPSLDGSLEKRGLPRKSTVVEDEFWSRGVDTPRIPQDILERYLLRDLEITDALYKHQLTTFPNTKIPLLKLQNRDLLVLLEMERNGIKFDWDHLNFEKAELEKECAGIKEKLNQYLEGWPWFNWNSGDHLSCLLYGGTISVDVSTAYEHTYKGGAKAGKTETRNKWRTESKTFPRLVTPIKGSELKKDGYWSVEEGTLRKTRGAKKLVDLLLRYSEIEKLLSTYYHGLPSNLAKYDWADGIIHGTFNQCVAITGRLSAERPNQQNFPEVIVNRITSRYC